MRKDRRKFMHNLSLAAGGMLLAPSTQILDRYFIPERRIKNFGLQLYTLRDDIIQDVKGVLQKVASAGYTQIESYDGPNGMWWGMGAKEFKNFVGDLGMTIISSHCDIFKDFEQKVEEAASIGVKYLICPWLGKQDNLDKYKTAAEDFNKKGEMCHKNGIGFGYHNHAYSFEAVDGIYPQDILMHETDSSLVTFEMDMYWVHAAGEKIEKWLNKYKNRFKLCHIKDFSRHPVIDNSLNSVDLGKGVIDWNSALKTAFKNGMEYFIVEQEAYPGTTPVDAIRANAAFMKKMKI